MINKGKIIFINGHWQNNWIGRRLLNSSQPNEAYWDDFNGFANAAQQFFGLKENIQDACVCLDGSSLVVIDESGSGRKERGIYDFSTYEWAGHLYKEITVKHGYELPETSFLRNKILSSEMHKNNLNALTKGMVKGKHAFYIVGHSEGCAYAAGLATLLLQKGWKVNFIIYLSSYDSGSFDSPKGVKAYQLGYTGKYLGDFATNNNPIKIGIERSAIVYKSWGYKERNKGGLLHEFWHYLEDAAYMHGSTKGTEVWIHLADLRTLMVRVGKTYGENWISQIPQSTPNHTVFASYNGRNLDYIAFMEEENSKTNQYNYKGKYQY